MGSVLVCRVRWCVLWRGWLIGSVLAVPVLVAAWQPCNSGGANAAGRQLGSRCYWLSY